jgi:hypothetical protein
MIRVFNNRGNGQTRISGSRRSTAVTLLQRGRTADELTGLADTCATHRATLVAAPPLLQPKLTLNHPGDCYEQEADQIAEAVMRMPEPLPQRESPAVTPALANQITALHGGGAPLPAGERAFFEPRFGYDFSSVRVHTGAQAEATAQAAQARAFTVGRDVVFGVGQYAPGTGAGRRLLGHELTHVVRGGGCWGMS